MNAPQNQQTLTANEIRAPRSSEECTYAIAIVEARIASIDTDLADERTRSRFGSQAKFEEWFDRATRARAVWASKLGDLQYWQRRIAADGDPALLEANARALRLMAELHGTWARIAQLAEGVELPAPLRRYIDARKAQLPPGFYDAFVAGAGR